MKKRIKACFRSKKSQVDSVGKNSEPYDEDLEYEQFLQREYKKPPLGDFTLSEYTEKGLYNSSSILDFEWVG